ncbi:MAG: cupin domain-containing protein [Pseudomonadales bacterium]
MSTDPEKHLQRAGSGAVRQLGTLTGMARMGIEERTLHRRERIRIAGHPAAEGFVYVLAGAGQVTCDGESQPIAAGDFLGIAAAEVLALENPHGEPLRLLVGFSQGRPEVTSPP